jgi:micrococcal nuclease
MVDGYGRTLAYVILVNSQSVGEILIENGFAKPYSKVYCDDLPKYQMLSLKAKLEKKGLFLFSDTF